ncbi:MAG: acyl carrier protein [Actinomycetota bacterium]
MDSVDVSNRIRDFIRDELLYGDANATLANDTPLLDNIMDSLGLMQLVAFLEQEFQIEVDDEDITTDHFRTIANIEQLVNRRVKQG